MTDVFLDKFKRIRQKYGILQERNQANTQNVQHQNSCQQISAMKRSVQHTRRLDLYEQMKRSQFASRQVIKSPIKQDKINSKYLQGIYQQKLQYHHPKQTNYRGRQLNDKYLDNGLKFDYGKDARNYSQVKIAHPYQIFNQKGKQNIIEQKFASRICSPSFQNMTRLQRSIEKISLNEQSINHPRPIQKNQPFSFTGTCFQNDNHWNISQLTKVQNKIQAFLRK